MKVAQSVRLGVIAAAVLMLVLLLLATPKRYEIYLGGSHVTEVSVRPVWEGRNLPEGAKASVFFVGLSPSVLTGEFLTCVALGLAVWAFASRRKRVGTVEQQGGGEADRPLASP